MGRKGEHFVENSNNNNNSKTIHRALISHFTFIAFLWVDNYYYHQFAEEVKHREAK